MKTRIQYVCMALLTCWINVGMLQAQENPTPLVTAKLEVYPEEIYYGDIFFNRVKVQNNMEETTWYPMLFTILNYGANVDLKQNDVSVYCWLPHFRLNELEQPTVRSTDMFSRPHGLHPFHEVTAQTTGRVFLRPLWFPMPEFSDSEETRALEAAVSSGKQQYLVEFSHNWKTPISHYGWKTSKENDEKTCNTVADMTCPITVKPRPKEDYDLLLEWYYELPATRDYAMWTEDAVFAHPFYIRDSPWQTMVYFRTDDRREPDQTTYFEFIIPLASRTPEALARIERTNELSAMILERAKKSDSTFSQNMVEFIQLRGLLVDMRYAENPEAEEAAFIKMMDFVDASQDRELWVDFLYDVGLGSIGLGSIEGNKRFSYSTIVEYRQRFAERMEIKNLCRNFDDYLQIYRSRKEGKD